MELGQAFECVAEVLPEELKRFQAHIDPAWIEEALEATGTATVRRRRLPAEQVVWMVLGMGLLRGEAIDRVVDSLELALPSGRGGVVARSAIAQARQRLGEEPLAYLFAMTAAAWAAKSADRHRWRGLALYGADGTTLRVADTQENRAAFGGQSAGGTRGSSGYPLVRVLGLMALRSHLLSALRFADYRTGEVTLAQELWRELPDNSLTILDRNFLVADLLTSLARSGSNRHWMTRAKSTTRLRTIRRLGRNDALVEIVLSDQTRRLHPELPAVWQARAITYQRKGFRPSVVLTSLLDADRYPAAELVELYHERWEIELGYDEIKTHMLARQETIRSKTPDGVRQEIWGIAIAYNLGPLGDGAGCGRGQSGAQPHQLRLHALLGLPGVAARLSPSGRHRQHPPRPRHPSLEPQAARPTPTSAGPILPAGGEDKNEQLRPQAPSGAGR